MLRGISKFRTAAVVMVAILGTSVFTAQQAHAGLMLEPYIGYEFGKTSDTDSTGVVLGGRVAYSLPVFFWFGVDYSLMAGGKVKTAGGDSDLTRSDLYAVAGVDFPILVRAWFGYGLMNTGTVKSNAGDAEASKGSNTKVGIGFTFLPLVSINVEMINHKDYEVKSGALTLTSTDSDNTTMVSLSLPLDI